ncbi:MAG: diaminopimelate decarboxylase [Armatimonadota bacterium]|nr:diaminopimelate decarboxylase [Armatimonadota bacterium]
MFERFLVGPSLEFGGVPLEDVAAEFGSPLYILDAAVVRARVRAYKAAAGDAHVAYASKANSTLALLQIILEEGLDVDVASLGELRAALLAGFSASQITFHGNAKSDMELHSAVHLGVRRVVVDHGGEIDRLALFAEAADKRVSVLVRVAPGVDPETHKSIRTGQDDSKFGFNIASGAAAVAIGQVRSRPSLHFRGLHFHVGSQLMNSQAQVAAVKRVATLEEEVGDTEELVVGGGLGIRYTPDDDPQGIAYFVDSIFHAVEKSFPEGQPHLGFEPGRSIVGEAGTTIYRVVVRKQVGKMIYIAIDGGLADNPRPQLYDAKYTAFNASRPGEDHTLACKIVGHHCETDTLIESADLPEATEVGDLIAVPATGAYNSAMASNYNRYPRPATVIVEGGKAFLAVARESIDDMFMKERLQQNDET